MLEKSIPIDKCDTVRRITKREHNIDVSIPNIRVILKQQIGLRYHIAKKIPLQGNSQRCLVLRKEYALKMIELMEKKCNIINVDESWINEVNFTR